MSVFRLLSIETTTVKHQKVKIISANTDKTQKELMNEAIDFIIDKYKTCLPK